MLRPSDDYSSQISRRLCSRFEQMSPLRKLSRVIGYILVHFIRLVFSDKADIRNFFYLDPDMLSLTMGLLTALAWGLTDFLISLSSRNIGVLRSLVYINGVALIPLALWMMLTSNAQLQGASAPILALSVVASGLVAIGALCLTKAFKDGAVSLVAPLIASYGAFTTLLAWFDGEALRPIQYIGVALCTLGIAINSATGRVENRKAGHYTALAYALLAAMLWGTSFWLQGQYILKHVKPAEMLFLNSLVGFVIAAFAMAVVRPVAPSLAKRDKLLAVAASSLNLVGFCFFTHGLANGNTAVVTVLSILSAAVASLIAIFINKEKPTPNQCYGGIAVVVGAMLLGVH